jgi:aspartate aminotransferase/aminotransferase
MSALKFSKRLLEIGSASSIEQNELVYRLRSNGFDPIILSYGEAPFTIERFELDPMLWDRGAHYSEGLGVPELRQALAAYSASHYGFHIDWQTNILVTAGSKLASFYVIQSLIDPGDLLVLHEPSWVSYQEHCNLSGGRTRFIPYDKDLTNGLYETQDPKDRVLCLNNPNNPRGYQYSEQEIREVADFCRAKEICLLIDESYSDFCANKNFFSGGRLIEEGYANVIVINSVSKNFGLSGWRIGYILGSDEVIKHLNRINQHLMTCASTNLQLALASQLESIRTQVRPQLEELNAKRLHVEELLKKYDIGFLSGGSTFYIFMDLRQRVKDSKSFSNELLLKKQVALIPGKSYGSSTEGFLRLSFAMESLERIELGISRLREQFPGYIDFGAPP